MVIKKFKGSLHFSKKKEDNKEVAFHTECRLKISFEDSEVKLNVIASFMEVELALPGEQVVSQIIFADNQLLPNNLYAGMSYSIFDLTAPVGQGTIINLTPD